MIRVLVVDDHAIVRTGLEQLLGTARDIEVVGTAADGAAAVAEARRVTPDIVLMDLSMPVMDGIEATKRIVEADPEARVVVLTSLTDRERILGALDAGTLGYLIGALIGWAIGRSGGRPLLERHGSWLHIGPETLERAEHWFERFGARAVFLGRITPVVRSFISIPAGVFRTPMPIYFPLTLAGSAIWCSLASPPRAATSR